MSGNRRKTVRYLALYDLVVSTQGHEESPAAATNLIRNGPIVYAGHTESCDPEPGAFPTEGDEVPVQVPDLTAAAR